MAARIFENVDELRAALGQEIGVSDWVVIDQQRIDAFAAATGDRQWIHVDAARARTESPFGTTVAHGFLTLSLVNGLTAQTIQVSGFKLRVNYGVNRLRFPAPVPVDSRVRARITLGAVDDIAGGVHLLWNVILELESSPKPAAVLEWLVRYYR
jgi:acyl dehydratase